MDKKAIVLKSDSRGRVRTPLQQRLALVAEFERSGLPATRFAALVGVRHQTFATWVQRHRKQQAAAALSESRPVRFAEVVLDESGGAPKPEALRIVLGAGAVLELTAAAQVPLAAQLIKALA